MRAEINGHPVYVSEDRNMVVSLSINDLMDPSKIRGPRSNTIEIVQTKEARRAVGGEFMAEADLFANGYPTFKTGDDSVNLFSSTVAPLSRSRNSSECIALGGNSKWFEFAKTCKLNEYDYGATDTRCLERVEPSWTDEDQFDYYPLVNYGALDSLTETDNMNPATDFRPALRVHRLIADALADEGFTVRPRGTLTKIWKKLVVLTPQAKITNDAYSDEYASHHHSATYPFDPSIPTIASADISNMPFTEFFDPEDNISGSTYTAPGTGTLRVNVNAFRLVINGAALAGKRFRYCLATSNDNFVTNVTVLKGWISPPIDAGDTEIIFSPSFEIQVAGGEYRTGLQIDDDTGISPGDIQWGNGASEEDNVEWIFRPLTTTEFEGGPWNGWRRLLYSSAAPDMTLADLFSALCLNLCLMVDTLEDGTVNIWYEKEFMRKPAQGVASRDWSTRMDHSTAPEKKINQNPIRILYKWKEDSNDLYLTEAIGRNRGRGYGDGSVEFAQGIAKEVVRTMPFAATVNGGGLNGAHMPALIKDGLDPGENSYQFAPRLLIADGLFAASWTFNGVFRDVDDGPGMPQCYFEKFIAEDFQTLGFEGSYYSEGNKSTGVLERLHVSKHRRMALPYLEAHMRIWDHELPDFDHGKPTLADDGSGPAWYYVQEIKNHAITKGRPTKTVLVPLPTREADGLIDNPAIEYPPQPEDDVCFGLAAFSDDVVEVDRAVIAQERAAIEAEDIAGMAVSGSGEAAANDTYAPAGTLGGKNAYHTGVMWQCFWFSAKWQITDGIKRYESTEDVLEPWMVVTWTAAGGAATPLPTVVGPTLSLGDTVLIRDHNTITPGSDIWEIHTGDVAEYVGAGNGESGSAWDFTTPAVGTVHKSLEDDTYWIRGFELTTTIYSDNGGTGALCVDYFYPPQVPGGAPPENLAIDPQSYETDVRVTFSGATADQCRTGFLEFSTNGGGTWDDHALGTFPDWSSNPPAAVECDWDIDADTLRIRWERSGHVQGYSQPITI